MAGYPKIASCACGALTLRATAPPKNVHACCCLNCQRRSGSVYTYTAFFAEADVTVSGEPKTWRSDSDAGRYQDTNFCPVCGVTVFSRLEALPGIVAVPVGTFADPDFAMPGKLYWTVNRHRWLAAAGSPELVERQ